MGPRCQTPAQVRQEAECQTPAHSGPLPARTTNPWDLRASTGLREDGDTRDTDEVFRTLCRPGPRGNSPTLSPRRTPSSP